MRQRLYAALAVGGRRLRRIDRQRDILKGGPPPRDLPPA
jgi:hypothetical protein